MGSFSNYAENKILDHANGKTAWTMPSVWVALSSTDPTEDGSGITEPSGGSYVRKSTVPADWNAASGGASSNANAITFVQATAAWGPMTHFATFDALSGGNMIKHGALGTPKTVGNGDTFSFPAGELNSSQD